MPALVQYAFNNPQQWKSAGEPKLIDTAHTIVELGEKDGKYHVEVLFQDYEVEVLDEQGNPTGETKWVDDVPVNGLLAAKAINPIPHKFIGYETLQEYELRKQKEQNGK